MQKLVKILLVAIVILLILTIIFSFINGYKNFRAVNELGQPANFGNSEEKKCEYYYEQCLCLGTRITFSSYPPIPVCKGLKFCWNINQTLCE